ncbi:MAG: hypothetical protein AMJ37_02740, partial [Dehalococcoidia bacterium DG_18]
MARPLLEMKASRIAALLIMLAVVSPLAVNALSAEAQDNLLQNPGFEDGAAGWEYSGGVLTYTNNPVYCGSRAAIFIISEAEGYIYQTIPVSPEA